MILIDAIKHKDNPFWVPDCPRNDLPRFFVDMGYKVGAEIGVFKGEYTKKFCEVGLKMYAVDPWIGYVGAGRSEKVNNKQNKNFQYAKKTLAPYPNCKIIRKTSMDGVKDFKDGSLDFVYIDGDHRFRYIAEDIFEWEKKVRSGGAVSGHDYFYTNPKANNVICHVGPIVDAFVKVKDIENFYVFGQLKKGGRNDRTLSWMWIKP
ncbi:MAG: class I SAM-dependent methyltransferase [Candidatus Sifarchaeia archaeon]|jgi:hypothetical protein